MTAAVSQAAARGRAHRRTPLLVAGIAFLGGFGLWAVTRSAAIQNTLEFNLTLKQAGPQIAIEWIRASDGRRNGVWLAPELLETTGEEWLELRPSGVATRAGQQPSMTLWTVTPLLPGTPPIDLKAVVNREDVRREGGPWGAHQNAPGIYYAGTTPGRLHFSVPPGGIELTFAATPNGGPVEVHYADQVQTIDLSADETTGRVVQLRRIRVTANNVHVRQVLPAYRISQLLLTWRENPGGRLTLSEPMLVTSWLGISLSRESCTPRPDALDPAAAKILTGDLSQPDGQIDLGPGPWVKLPVSILHLVFCLAIAGLAGAAVAGFLKAGTAASANAGAIGVTLVGLAIIVRLWMAVWSPLLVYPDSTDFIYNAARFLESGNFAHVHPSQMPGYSLFLSPLIAGFDNFARPLAFIQASLGVVSGLLVAGILRHYVPSPWPWLGFALFSLNPMILGYERVALTETLATFLITLIVYLALALAESLLQPGRRIFPLLLAAAGIGVLCGAGAYVRGNLQMLIVLVPVVLLIVGAARRPLALRATQGLLVLVCGAACLIPWIYRNHVQYGRAEFVIGRDYQKLVDNFSNDLKDINQTAAFSYDRWRTLRGQDQTGGLTSLQFLNALYDSGLTPAEPLPRVLLREAVSGPAASETAARLPGRTLGKTCSAFAVQLGLWDKFPTFNRGAGNVYLLSPHRGSPTPGGTNLMFNPGELGHATEKRPLLDRITRPVRNLSGSMNAALYQEWFWAFRFLAPMFALVLLGGTVAALRSGVWGIAAVAALVLANAAALAILLQCDYDRYAIPYTGLSAVVVSYGCWRVFECLRRVAVNAERQVPPGPNP